MLILYYYELTGKTEEDEGKNNYMLDDNKH